MLDSFGGDVLDIAWGPGGRYLIASGESPDVSVWDLDHLERRVAGNLHRQLEVLGPDLTPDTDTRPLRDWVEDVLGR